MESIVNWFDYFRKKEKMVKLVNPEVDDLSGLCVMMMREGE